MFSTCGINYENIFGNFAFSGFPSVLGAVDGTLTPIQAQHQREFDYVCREGFHAINAQVTSWKRFFYFNNIALYYLNVLLLLWVVLLLKYLTGICADCLTTGKKLQLFDWHMCRLSDHR